MLRHFTKDRTTLFLGIGLVVVVLLGWLFVTKVLSKTINLAPVEEDLSFDPQGAYALLLPRRDGNAIVLNIRRVLDYDEISYEMAYQSQNDAGEMVDRGVTGKLNLQDKKSEYTQEILFGTCSKGDTFSTLHCVFDKNVENGTLTLHIKKITTKRGFLRTEVSTHIYNMNTTWHLQKPDVALGKISSADTHFNYTTSAGKDELAVVGFTAVNDLTGVPKLPDGKAPLGKVYALNVPEARSLPGGEVKIELATKPSVDAKIAQYIEKDDQWKMLDTKATGSTLSAQGDGVGIYAVLATAK